MLRSCFRSTQRFFIRNNCRTLSMTDSRSSFSTAVPPLYQSHHPALRQRAALYEQGTCHICKQLKSNQPSTRPHYCSGCGLPTHCSSQCHANDSVHSAVCGRLQRMMQLEDELIEAQQRKSIAPSPPLPSVDSMASSEDKLNNLKFDVSNASIKWSDFFQFRGFRCPTDAHSMVYTHALTFPLTLARTFAMLFKHIQSADFTNSCNIFIVGAGPEASLPIQNWEEALVLMHPLLQSNSTEPVELNLHFIGPAIHESVDTKIVKQGAWGGDRARLRMHFHRAKFHELANTQLPRDPHLVVCFNSGVGFTGGATESHWLPTLNLMFGDKSQSDQQQYQCPVVFTSFDVSDAERDVKLLEKFVGSQASPRWLLPLQQNAFPSLRVGFDFRSNVNYVFAPNQYLCAVESTFCK